MKPDLSGSDLSQIIHVWRGISQVWAVSRELHHDVISLTQSIVVVQCSFMQPCISKDYHYLAAVAADTFHIDIFSMVLQDCLWSHCS